jgi:predicted transposase YbfD/YdcC
MTSPTRSRLLELLDLSGALVTIDAMGCQKEIAARIVVGGGDYILAAKDNQRPLHRDIDDSFMAAMEADFAGLDWGVARTGETNRGRKGVRECRAIVRPAGPREAGLWKGLTAIRMPMGRRVVDGVEGVEFRYFIGSFAGTAEEYPGAIRSHWSIENSLHWALDVVFRESVRHDRRVLGRCLL